MHIRLLALAAAFPLYCAPASGGVVPQQAAPAPPPPADSDQLLLFAVQLDNATLTESLTAYGDPADPLIPLGELSRLLDLALDVQPGSGLVTGRIGESQRALTIDLRMDTALLGDSSVALLPAARKVTPTDVFLPASLVSKLLPIKIVSSPDELLLTLTATEKLPIQAKRERAARLAGLSGAPDEVQEEVLRVPTPYRWVGLPAFDFGLELGADSGRGRPTSRFEGRVAADLAQTGVVGWLATDDAGNPSSARLTASRRSPEGRLLGPLHATYAAAGDVYSPALPLGPRSGGGLGFVISSARTEQTSVFERINLRGELPIGYDIELYVNNVLRSGQEGAKTQGRYEFNDVPLVRGLNVIRIVLYGPRGERSEQTRVINVGGGQLAAGQTVVDGGVVARERPLFNLSDDELVPGDRGRGAMRAVLQLQHGLTADLTVAAGFGSYADTLGARHDVLTGGLRTSLLGMALQGDIAKDFTRGAAASLGIAGRISGVSLLARHVEYSGGFSDETSPAWDAARPMRRYSELTFDLAVPFLGGAQLPLSGRVERAQFADGGVSFAVRGRTTATFAGTLIGLGADYTRRTTPDATDEQLVGNISASRFIGYVWQVRAVADYRLKPELSLESLGVTVDRPIGERYSLRFGASRSFASRDITLETGLTAHLPMADATLGGDYSTSQQRWRLGLQLNFGVAFDPMRRSYRMTPPGPANGGSAALMAFIDDNANGRPDPGEAPVPGVEVQGTGSKVLTDARGRAFVTGLGDSATAMLRADISNTDTVFVTPPPASISFAPRAGSVAAIYYPMVPTSELVVRVNFRQRDGSVTGLSAVHLRIVGEDGHALAATTEFDGTAVVDAVKPGTYRIELDPEQAARLGMRLAAPLTVTVGTDGSGKMATGEVVFAK